MDYRDLNDNELVYLCAENNEDAINLIVNKYKNCILMILKEYLKEYNIIGVEVADLYQEGLIGLMHAIHSYNPTRDVLFYTYANACIRTSLMSAIRQTFRQKNRILNYSYSLDKIFEDSGDNFYEILKDESYEPNKLLLSSEDENELINKLKSKLSKSELAIFELRLKGLSNGEIASLIDKDTKYIENSLFRIKRKYKELNKVVS
ncbi:MAG: sigma-70 family RNA polymerase sigma factor [Mollicutes bacterium]|nr:sigma-70 family RNA polymerase sigma factor [Mollicutes bacterium]